VAAPAISSPNQEANRRFTRARVLFTAGSMKEAEQALLKFIADFPDDPLVPLARMYCGRIAMERGDLKQARRHLEKSTSHLEAEASRMQARYYLGLVSVKLGDHARGVKLLKPFVPMLAPEKLPPVLWALYRASAGLKDLPAAAGYLSRWHQITNRPVEKAHCREKLSALVDNQLTPTQLKDLFNKAEATSLLRALSGRKLAAAADAAGKRSEAARILEQSADARSTHRIRLKRNETVSSRLVGLLTPLSGPYRVAGQQLMSGAVEGSRSLGSYVQSAGTPGGVTLLVRDSSHNPAEAALELVRDRGVIALVGTLNPSAARSVAAVAATHGTPFISLSSPGASKNSSASFHIFPHNQARVEALARHAARHLRLKKMAILAPRTRYGEQMSKAMKQAFSALGGEVVHSQVYAASAISFANEAKTLARHPFDALFVPDTARTLALIAPSLAKEGLWAGATKATTADKRTFRLLATADGLTTGLLDRAGRYVDQAVLAPGFFPDPLSPSTGPRLRLFRQTHGRLPTLLQAYAHDAVSVVRARILAGAKERSTLMSSLCGVQGVDGFSGTIRFHNHGRRADPPQLFSVIDRKIKQLAASADPATREANR